MITEKYFTLEKSTANPTKYIIRFDCDKIDYCPITGSYALIAARLLGLSYAQYLRYCRDIVGAEIQGKSQLYPIAYFELDEKSRNLVKLLNTRMTEVMLYKKEMEENKWNQ